jgi:hypothetical protein
LTQACPHKLSPAEQTQTPLWQLPENGHEVPHPPQFCESVSSSTQAAPHNVFPMEQMQIPFWQVAWSVQEPLHPPQCLESVCSSTHEPEHIDSPTAHAPTSACVEPFAEAKSRQAIMQGRSKKRSWGGRTWKLYEKRGCRARPFCPRCGLPES